MDRAMVLMKIALGTDCGITFAVSSLKKYDSRSTGLLEMFPIITSSKKTKASR